MFILLVSMIIITFSRNTCSAILPEKDEAQRFLQQIMQTFAVVDENLNKTFANFQFPKSFYIDPQHL